MKLEPDPNYHSKVLPTIKITTQHARTKLRIRKKLKKITNHPKNHNPRRSGKGKKKKAQSYRRTIPPKNPKKKRVRFIHRASYDTSKNEKEIQSTKRWGGRGTERSASKARRNSSPPRPRPKTRERRFEDKFGDDGVLGQPNGDNGEYERRKWVKRMMCLFCGLIYRTNVLIPIPNSDHCLFCLVKIIKTWI